MTQQESILLLYNYAIIYSDSIEWKGFMAPGATLMYVWIQYLSLSFKWNHYRKVKENQKKKQQH